MIFKLLLFFSVVTISFYSCSQESTDPEPSKQEIQIADCGEPFYSGGHQAMMIYIREHLSLPDSCLSNELMTKLYVKLLIDTSGTVSKVELLDSEFLAEECKEQITQVFFAMKGWNPGIYNGKPENRHLTLPIRIKLD